MANMVRSRVAARVMTGLLPTLSPLSEAALTSAQAPQPFSDWSSPTSIGPPINTALAEMAPFISRDGRSLYHVRGAGAGGFGGMENRVGFGEFGANDLYVSRRHNKRDDFSWRPAANLGGAINTAGSEIAATIFEDDATGVISLYFASNRPGGPGEHDIDVSTLLSNETFGPAVLVEELSTPSADLQPTIGRDGLELLLSSSRPGTLGSLDLWVSTRNSTTEPWSVPVNLGGLVNGPGQDARASLSFDGTELYFQSNRNGNADIYRSTRSKLKEPD